MKNAKGKEVKAFLVEREEMITSALNPHFIPICVILAKNWENAVEIARQLSLRPYKRWPFFRKGNGAYDYRIKKIMLVEKGGYQTLPHVETGTWYPVPG